MLTMDKYPVLPGDQVWDSRDGWGEVEAVYDKDFAVRNLGHNRVRLYTSNGIADRRKERTLWWNRLDLFIPAKGATTYAAQLTMMREVSESIDKYVRAARNAEQYNVRGNDDEAIGNVVG